MTGNVMTRRRLERVPPVAARTRSIHIVDVQTGTDTKVVRRPGFILLLPDYSMHFLLSNRSLRRTEQTMNHGSFF